MPIINREKDPSEQRELIDSSFTGVVTGATLILGIVPYPASLVTAQSAAIGLSGAPVHSLAVNRFVVGSGITTIGLAATLTISAMGTSGTQGYSSASFGVTTSLLAGDLLLLNTGGANTAVAQLGVEVVIKCLQDYKSYYGL